MLLDKSWLAQGQEHERVRFADEKGKSVDSPRNEDAGNREERGTCACCQPPAKGEERWKVLIVDDDEGVLTLTCSVLRNFTFEGRELYCLYANSGAQAMAVAAEHPDLALMLLDVVMETEHAGLDVVRHVREVIGNRYVRIVLRTGQPGFAPEEQVIRQYDINDYREKADLSSQRLRSVVVTGLRAYRDLRTIEQLAQSNEVLEARVQERTRELEENRASLDRAQRIARMGSWEWIPKRQLLVWSDEACRLMGIPAGSHGKALEEVLERIPSSQLDGVRHAILGSVERGGRGFQVEHLLRVQTARGEIAVRHVGEIQRDGQGAVVRVQGTILDVTELREAENRLTIASRVFEDAINEAEDAIKVTAKVFEHALERVTVTDVEGTILAVNPAFTVITGYAANEVLGKNIRILRSDRHDDAFFVQMWRTLDAEGRWHGEVWNRRKNGDVYPERLAITAIRVAGGSYSHYVSISTDLSDIRRSQDELRFMTYHDVLTGLPNRHLFMDRLQQAINFAHRSREHVAVVEFDLDMFKYVNESLGHAAGDLALRVIAERFRGNMRDGDTVSRLAGDRFGFVIRDIPSVRSVMTVVEKLRRVLGEPILMGEHEHVFSASIGITLYPNDAADVAGLMRNVDIAVTRAKKSGRDNFQFYTQAMGDRAARRMALEGSLRKGIENKEFVMYYQPKIDAKSGQIVGMESLVRWNHPESGLLSPAEFIPVAEETGLIVPLGEWILRTACEQTAQWIRDGFTELRVAVNLSARQFRRKEIKDTIQQVLQETGLTPDRLELEITESMVMDDVEDAITILRSLHDMGLRISVDDFGTGYSSLTYLKQFPINTLKIDQTFVRNLPASAEDASIIAAIISMARSLHLNVVAEGVETLDHLNFLQSVECDEIQGFYFSKPLPAQQFRELLDEEARGASMM